MLNFVTLQSNYPELRKWGASAGRWTFVISKDEEEFEYEVSLRIVGKEGGQSLGAFQTFEGAKIACQNFLTANPVAPT